MTNIWVHKHAIAPRGGLYLDPFGNAVHTALEFPVLGEDVLITGAGPIGIMAAAVARHAGARHVVITDLNSYRLGLARKVGVTLAVDPREKNLKDVQRDLGMSEGFDVGFEMSGSASAFRDMIANMSHGGPYRPVGNSARRDLRRLEYRDLQHADHPRHLWPGNVRDLVSDDGHAGVGARHQPGDHAPVSLQGLQRSFRADEVRQFRQNRAGLGERGIVTGDEFCPMNSD